MRVAELPSYVHEQIADARVEVAALHSELIRWGLVVWTAGNVSSRIRCADDVGTDLLAVKPPGVFYDDLCPENMVVCDLEGNKLQDSSSGNLLPSSDMFAHAFVYSHMTRVGGVVHTHSAYATAWAATGRPLPCGLTMMCDELGGETPIGPLAIIGDDSIGRGIVDTLQDSPSPAVLMANHGPFTVGNSAKDAVKAAVMCEQVAHTMFVAEQLGSATAIPQEMASSLYSRYQNVYGQHRDPVPGQ